MMINNNKSRISIFLLITFIIALAGWFDLFNLIQLFHLYDSVKWQIILVFTGIIGIIPFLIVIGYWIPVFQDRISYFLGYLLDLKISKWIYVPLILLFSVSYSLAILSFYGKFLEGPYLRFFMVWLLAILCAIVPGKQAEPRFIMRMAFGLLLIGFFHVLSIMQRNVSTSAFTLSWSEASRYYYASLFDSIKLYGERLAWPFLHPSRYLLQSIPYFVGDFPIIIHRLWQVALWIIMPLITIWIFQKRIINIKGYAAWVFIIWSYLFMYQGPVYYHLFVCVWLVLLGYNKDNIWQTTVFVILGSLWAGISRVNWFPVPAMIAITLYLLDNPFPGKKKFVRYFIPPAIFTSLGLISAFIGQIGYAFLSGEERIDSFGSSFTSDLLWYRLFPNTTNSMGIVFPIVLLTFPVLVFLFINVKRNKYSFWQYFPIVGINSLLFFGGLIVSTKIGGGGNLHNMDAWLVLLWILTGKLMFDEQTHTEQVHKIWKPSWISIIILLLPFVYLVHFDRSYASMNAFDVNTDIEQEDIRSILNRANEVSKNGKEVLFISQRQLLIFEENDIPFVSDYELLTLMEMAISNNQPYLEIFRADLENHRFGMILVEKQVEKITTMDEGYFSEENNAWVKELTIPLLENYEEVRFYPYSNLTILQPKP
jgi:hypothetical protein